MSDKDNKGYKKFKSMEAMKAAGNPVGGYVSSGKANDAVDFKRYGEGNTLGNRENWAGGTRDQADRRKKDIAALERGGRTAGRIASRGMRAETSAKYRLAQAKADAKARKRKILEPGMPNPDKKKKTRKLREG
jgi:hypothetical protein